MGEWGPLAGAGQFQSVLPKEGTSREPFVGCFLYETTATSIDASGWNALTFEVALHNTNGFHGGDTSRIVIPANMGGFYRITGQVAVVGTGGSKEVMCRVLKNGAVLLHGTRVTQATLAIVSVNPPPLFLNPDDYLQLQGFQSDAGAQLTYIGAALEGSFFGVELCGPSPAPIP